MATTYDLIDNISSPKDLVVGDVLKFQQIYGYEEDGIIENVVFNKGIYRSIELPKGVYKLECWGAQGGKDLSYYGGYGGYSYGTITLNDPITTLFLYPGGCPEKSAQGTILTFGGFNGGGLGGKAYLTQSGSGGGGTDIRIGQDSLYARVIVAGGGAGAFGINNTAYTTAYGGGINGGANENSTYPITDYAAGQTHGGLSTYGEAGSFGFGKRCGYRSSALAYVAPGGGGGWYGGGSAGKGYSQNTVCYGVGGGSGYVYTEATASNYPSGCLLNPSYYLTDAQTIAGNQSFPSFDTSTNKIGHQGMGAIKITVLDISKFKVYIKTNNIWKQADSAYIKNNSGVWVPVDSIHVKNNNSWS